MGYKYSKGSQVIGDLKAADDTQRDTKIDFEEDYIGFETSGSVKMVISGSEGGVGIGVASPTEALDVSGSIKATGYINAKQRDVKFSKYTESSEHKRFIRFNSTGTSGNKNCGQNTIFIAPTSGSLLSLSIRCKSLARSTDIVFHRADDGFGLPTQETSTSPDYNPMPVIVTENVDIDTANKTFVVNFSNATFTPGQILALSVDPTNAPNDVNITTVWLFDWNS